MEKVEFVKAQSDEDIHRVAVLAEEIWHEHFTDIIGEAQVNYMVEKFQSYPALKAQIADGYEYYQIMYDGQLAGYTGVHPENGKLFLSKLYLHKDFRGKHLSTKAFHFLTELCRKRNLSSIWLTCNKHNDHTLKVYDHLGFHTIRSEKNDIGNGFYMDDYIMEYSVTG